MTLAVRSKVIGDPVDRIDGPLKVTGSAPYPSDVTLPGLAHAVLVQSTIAAGVIKRISSAAARDAPGVLLVLTYENTPAVADGPMTEFGPPPPYPLRDNRVHYHGQTVTVVVAETHEQAVSASRLVKLEYEESAPTLGIDNAGAQVSNNPWGTEIQRGDVEAALAAAEVKYDQWFTIPPETNNPLGLFATVVRWNGDQLEVHDSTQWPVMVRRCLATMFGIPERNVRVLVPYLGGGFGAGLRLWPHVPLAAVVARIVARPVKLALTRPQMFTSVGHRPQSRQRIRIGASRDGRLVALDHDATSTLGVVDGNIAPITWTTPVMYACPNLATHDHQIRLNIPFPAWMRAPGTAEGNFALESALDELSYELAIDPIDLRLRNYSERHPSSGLPWSSKALRECYRVAAERFGWSKRNPNVGSMRDGDWLVGFGMASVAYEFFRPPCEVSLAIRNDGTALLRSAATDIGTGTYTIATQLVADLLGLDRSKVKVEIGDSDLPPAPQSGGSGLAGSLSTATYDAACNLVRAFLDVVATDDASPLRGSRLQEVAVEGGYIHRVNDPSVRERYTDILGRHGLADIAARGEIKQSDEATMAPTGAFAAHFVEVRVDKDLGLPRVARVVTAVDAGRVLNEKTARSQIMGATVMGIGMTLFEEMLFEPRTGRIANATFGDYLIPVNADIPDLDVVFVGEPDKFGPVGTKGVGEVGVVGMAAAIANAVFHATGRRIRSLPITVEKLLDAQNKP